MDRDAIDDELDAEMADVEEKAQRELTPTPMRGREDDDWTPAEAILDGPPHESENDSMDDPPDPSHR